MIQMDAATVKRDHTKTKVSVIEDDRAFESETAQLHTLNLSWPVVCLVIDSRDACKLVSKFCQHLLLSYSFQLLVVLPISFVCIGVGIGYLGDDSSREMLCILFIIQGACGVLTVFVYTCVNISL